MQKISTYLYPNRINVVADLAVFPVRWNIVYQNRVKIYKGVDNLITVDVKNAEQKRIDISSMTLKMGITDTYGQEIGIFDITADPDRIGLATVNVSADELIYVTPQFLKFTIYKLNNNSTKTIFYADTQFGAMGNMELVGSAVPIKEPRRYISRFIPLTNDSTQPFIKEYFGDAVEITQSNAIKDPILDSVILTFLTVNLEAEITIQFTKDAVISSATDWQTIETFNITSSVTTIEKAYYYPNYNREYTWARVKYKPLNQSTGKIDKVIISFEELDQLFLDGGTA
jgi:acyl carrier protein